MIIDRTTKTLLGALAAGVWLNLLTPWLYLTPLHAQATATAVRGAVEFLDYQQLVEQRQRAGAPADEIQLLLLAHIAGNTRAAIPR